MRDPAMPRTIPDDRLAKLVDCATEVFIAQGYQRTQMADVAHPFEKLPALPIRTPKPAATVKYIRERLAKQQVPAALTAALATKRVADPRAELEGIVRELYDALARNRRGIK